MAKRLHDKIAIITGASRGIGKGIASVFAQQGCHLLLIARQEAPLAATTATLRQQATALQQIDYLCADISKATDMEKMAQFITEKYGRLDILCQNAGIYPETRIEMMQEQDWDTVLDINLKGTFLAVQKCLPLMQQQQYGKIILITSITGIRVGNPGLAHYGASKGGIDGFMKTAAIEFAPYNITINSIEPGNIITEGLAAQLGDEYIDKMCRAIPMRKLGTPEDIGHAALFFATDESHYITGQSLVVDGGQILPESAFHIE